MDCHELEHGEKFAVHSSRYSKEAYRWADFEAPGSLFGNWVNDMARCLARSKAIGSPEAYWKDSV